MRRAVLRVVAVVSITLALLACLEAALALAGVQGLSAESDPFLGFSRRVRVFAADPVRGVYVTPPSAVARSFNHQEFQLRKPANGFRAFTLGGSSAYGFPWGAEIAFTRVLGDALRASHPGLTIEAVNAAGMSYGSNRLRVLAHEVIEYAPDAVIVYEGHNEFIEAGFYRQLLNRDQRFDAARSALHRWRLFTVASRVAARTRRNDSGAALVGVGLDVERDEPTGVDAGEKERVRARFEENLREIVTRVQTSGARIVLCTVAANLRDWRPYLSAFNTSRPAVVRQRVLAALSDGQRLLASGNAAAALPALEQARAFAPEYADTHFMLGRAYEAMQRWDAARDAYTAARDADTQPARVISSINDSTRRVARETGAILVDIDRAFAAASPHGLVGFNLVEDYVHPNGRGHRVIALELWRAFEARGIAGAPRDVADEAFWKAVGEAPADPSTALGDVPSWRAAALLYNTGVILEHQDEIDRAIAKYREALSAYPKNFGAAINLGRLLAMKPDPGGAADAFRLAVASSPKSARALRGYGTALVQVGRAAEAETMLRSSLDIEPRSVAALSFLGHARRLQGNAAGAAAAYREALAIDPSDRFVIASLRDVEMRNTTSPR